MLTLLAANFGSIMGGVLFLLLLWIETPLQWFPWWLVIVLCIVNVYLRALVFEYQRITLAAARVCLETKSSTSAEVVALQVLMTNDRVATATFFNSLLTGLVFALLWRVSWIALAAFAVIKYLSAFLPVPLPIRGLFRLVENELAGKRSYTAQLLRTILSLMPRDRTYGAWAMRVINEVTLRNAGVEGCSGGG